MNRITRVAKLFAVVGLGLVAQGCGGPECTCGNGTETIDVALPAGVANCVDIAPPTGFNFCSNRPEGLLGASMDRPVSALGQALDAVEATTITANDLVAPWAAADR